MQCFISSLSTVYCGFRMVKESTAKSYRYPTCQECKTLCRTCRIRKTLNLGKPIRSVCWHPSLCKLRPPFSLKVHLPSALRIPKSPFWQLFITTTHITVFILRFIFWDVIYMYILIKICWEKISYMWLVMFKTLRFCLSH